MIEAAPYQSTMSKTKEFHLSLSFPAKTIIALMLAHGS
jgi:hypothetical protein